MFEAKLAEGHVFKKIVESIKDIVNDINFDVGPTGKSYSSVYEVSLMYSYRNLTLSHGQFTCSPRLNALERRWL